MSNPKLVYVKYTPTITGTSSANLINSSIGANDIIVSAIGTGINTSSNVVISEIYGAGGNSGSIYRNDFIELYNPNSFTVDLAGWSVQYAGATSSSWRVTPLSGSISPKGYYLIQQTGGNSGTLNLPTPNATGNTTMSATNGKVLLTNVFTPQTGARPTGSHIIDFVGFGASPNGFEGGGPAPAISTTRSIERKASSISTSATLAPGGTEEFNGNGHDSNNNNNDFVTNRPYPQNSAEKEPKQNLNSFIKINTSELSFGNQSILSTSEPKSYEISAKNIVSKTIISVSAPFSVSKDQINYTNSIEISTAEFAVNQKIYVKFSPTNTGNVKTLIAHQNSEFNQINLEVTGTGIDPSQTVFNFEHCSTALPNSLADGFYQFSNKGIQKWTCSADFGHDSADVSGVAHTGNSIQINGFENGNNENEDWLISPPLLLSNMNYAYLSFWSHSASAGSKLQLKVSTTYSGHGDPKLANWTDLEANFPESGSNLWTKVENINLTPYKAQTVYVAFVYTSTTNQAGQWAIDNFEVINRLTPPVPQLTVSENYINFGAQNVNSTSNAKVIVLSGINLTANVELVAPVNFSISKNSTANFSNSITLDKSEIDNKFQNIYIKFSPTTENINFDTQLSITSSGATDRKVQLKGNSFDISKTLEVINWNLEWFGSSTKPPLDDSEQAKNVKKIVNYLSADVYAFAEVVDTILFRNHVLPTGYNVLFSDFGSFADNKSDPDYASAQKLAFMYRTDLIKPIRTLGILRDSYAPGIPQTSDDGSAYTNWSSGRFPFMMEAEVNIDGKKENINFIQIHAKANTGTNLEKIEAYQRRKNGNLQLKNWIDENLKHKKVIILGDFNDVLESDKTIAPLPPGTSTSYLAFITDMANYFPVSVDLSLSGKKSTVHFNTLIDNVIVNKNLMPNYVPKSVAVLDEVKDLAINYGNTTSTHFPMLSRFLFGNGKPTLNDIPDQSICYSSAVNIISIDGISAGPETDQTTSLSVSSNKRSVFEQLEIIAEGKEKAFIKYKLKSNHRGNVEITVTVDDDGGTDFGGVNSISKTFMLKINSLPNASITGDATIIQNSTSPYIQFTATNGTPPYTFTYHINNQALQTISTSNSFVNLPVPTNNPGEFTYYLTKIADANCSSTIAGKATILVRPLPIGNISGATNVCINAGSPVVKFKAEVGTAPFVFSYQINGGQIKTISTNTNTAEVDAPTNIAGSFNYTLVSISDAYASNNQNQTAVVTVNPLPNIIIKANRDTVISKGSSLSLEASGGLYYSWEPFNDIIDGQGTKRISIRPRQSTTYKVKAINSSGCESYKSIHIKVEEDYNIKPANIITPNGDGKNDFFYIENIDFYPKNTIKIFDKSGRLVYTKQGYLNEWDGTLNGVALGTNTYYYVLSFGENIKQFKGAITLIRN
jgi:gliding motility-associated-like protein